MVVVNKKVGGFKLFNLSTKTSKKAWWIFYNNPSKFTYS